jgi:hypothetical protein
MPKRNPRSPPTTAAEAPITIVVPKTLKGDSQNFHEVEENDISTDQIDRKTIPNK